MREYFKTIGVRLLAGRPLTAEDQNGKWNVVVINETIAKYFDRPMADPRFAVIGRCRR